MRRGIVAFAMILMASALIAQEAPTPTYTQKTSPFMGEFAFTAGQPVDLHVEVDGVRIDSVTITPAEEVRPDATIRCSVQIVGQNVGEKRATVSVVLLLEEENGRGLDRVKLGDIRPRSGRSFDETQRHDIPGASLQAAKKLYVYVEVS